MSKSEINWSLRKGATVKGVEKMTKQVKITPSAKRKWMKNGLLELIKKKKKK